MIGATADAIDKAEDRALFRDAMTKIGLETPRSKLANASELKGQDREQIPAPAGAHRRARSLRCAEETGARRVRARLDQAGAGAARALSGSGADRGAAGARLCRAAGDHPAVVHARRHRRRHRLQQGRVPRNRRARPRRFAHQRSADRGERSRLEGIRDGGGPRQGGQLHHHLLDREFRPDGRAHRRLDHHRAGADADRQRIPDHARRLDCGAARDRGRDRRLERAVRGQSGGRPARRHRDEPARVALVRARLQGDRLSDRQGRRQACGRLHARRDRERHHRRRDARELRADDRLRRHQDPALRVREIPRRRADADHLDEVGRRGDGDRPHVPGVAAEGAALARNRPHRPRRDHHRGTGARATTRT